MVTVWCQTASFSRMFSVLLIFGILSVGSAVQQLVVMHAPKYVTFQQQTADLQTSQLPGMVANTLGVGAHKDIGWQGMLHSSVFKRPKANVMLTVEIPPALADKPLALNNMAKFPVMDDLPFFDLESVRNSIQKTFLDQEPLMLDLLTDNTMFDLQSENQLFKKLPNSLRQVKDRLHDPDSVIQKLTSGSLNSSLTPDMTLMGEMQMVNDIIQTLFKNPGLLKNKSPDLFSFTVSGLKSVVDKHGAQSSQTADAQKMLTDFIHSMTGDLKKLYKDNVVVEVFLTTMPKGQSRKVRSLMADPTPVRVALHHKLFINHHFSSGGFHRVLHQM
ncbi:renin receptor-like [Gigantopelta aegis]|uniref:renin receptor-like n=1 Tax=Gigantopelta aegis TaxID=1735272 RepID=UPI001B88C02E|nr:renin receptor-like [Gigantopelta aegis]